MLACSHTGLLIREELGTSMVKRMGGAAAVMSIGQMVLPHTLMWLLRNACQKEVASHTHTYSLLTHRPAYMHTYFLTLLLAQVEKGTAGHRLSLSTFCTRLELFYSPEFSGSAMSWHRIAKRTCEQHGLEEQHRGVRRKRKFHSRAKMAPPLSKVRMEVCLAGGQGRLVRSFWGDLSCAEGVEQVQKKMRLMASGN